MKIFIFCLAGIVVIYLGLSAAIDVRSVPREPVMESPIGMEYEDVSFPSRVDNVTLRGWYMSGGELCIIVVNRGQDNRVNLAIGTLEITSDLVDSGFSVLLFDQRGRGESDGKGLLLVHTDRDLGGAVDYIVGRGHSKVYLLGFSTGAASSIMFAAANDGVIGIISDSCFTDVHEMFIRGMVEQGFPELLTKILVPGIFLVARIRYGCEPVNPVDVVGDITCPLFFIHGEEDSFTPAEDAHKLLQASGNPLDDIWVVPGADNCLGYRTNPGGYIDRLISFLEKIDS